MFLTSGPEELRALLDAFAVPMFVVDVEPDGTLRYAAINAALEAAAGRTSAELVGRRPEDCLAPEVAAHVTRHYRACVATGRMVRYEVSLSGPTEHWRTTLSPLMADGRVVRPIAVSFDITDLRRAQLARQQSEQRLAVALDAADAGLYDIDLRTGKAVYNERAETMLRGLGVRVAIDDFGTGYSSMARLRNLPVDRLKVDRSFVADIVADRSHAAIVESMIRLADSLNVGVIAEGIETDAQLRLLQELGCHEGQGFVFARPMPEAALADWIGRWAGRRAPGTSTGRTAPRRGGRRVKAAVGA